MRLARLPSSVLPLRMMSSAAGSPIRRGSLRRAAPRREDAELRLRQSDLRLRAVGHDAPVAADGQLAAAAERGAVDRGDGDLRQLREAMEGLLPEARVLLAPARRDVDLRELGDVGAGDEDRRLAARR